jgi:putative sensory transduction regulator
MQFHKLLLAAALLTGVSAPAFAAGTLSRLVTDTSSESSSTETSSSDSSSTGTSSSESPTIDSSSSAEPNPQPTPSGMVTAQDPQSVLDELSSLGYPGKLGKLDNGRPTISVRVAGFDTYIDFYDCADDMTECYTLLFSATADMKSGTTLDKANQWNSDKITGRVWLDKDNDPTIDFSLSTYAGVSTDVFDQNVKLWADDIDEFKSYFGIR